MQSAALPPPESISHAIARFAADSQWPNLAAPVQSAVRRHLMDLLGCAVRGSLTGEAEAVRQVATRYGGRPEASVLAAAARFPAPMAALVNGTQAHAIELDDTHAGTFLHPGAVIVPAALAAGQRHEADGARVLTGIAVGYEVSIRIADAVNPAHRLRGFHTTPTTGVFGATVAAAVVEEAPHELIRTALGIAGSQAAGLFEFLSDGANIKRVHPGLAAMKGVMSLDLARAGIAGPGAVLEGPHGFVRAYADGAYPDGITDGLGERWRLPEVGIKPYPACRYAHGAIDAALALRSRIDGADTISEVEILVSRLCAEQTGNVEPKTTVDRQMSTPYGVSVALLRGVPALEHYETPDAEALRLARRTRMTIDAELSSASRQSTVTVRLETGQSFTATQELPTGEPSMMPEPAMLERKFIQLVAPVLGDSRAGAALDRIRDLPDAPGLDDLMRALTIG